MLQLRRVSVAFSVVVLNSLYCACELTAFCLWV